MALYLCKAVAVLLAVRILICVQCIDGGSSSSAAPLPVSTNSSFPFVKANEDDEYLTAVDRSTTLGSSPKTNNSNSSCVTSEYPCKNTCNTISTDSEIDFSHRRRDDFPTNVRNVSTCCSHLLPLNSWNWNSNEMPHFSCTPQNRTSITKMSYSETGAWSTSTADTAIDVSAVQKSNNGDGTNKNTSPKLLPDADMRNESAAAVGAGENVEATGVLSPTPSLPTTTTPSPPKDPPYINVMADKNEKSTHSPNNLKRLLQQLEVS